MKTLLDLIKLGTSVGISAAKGDRVMSCLWELTYRCTAKCSICNYWKNPSDPDEELTLNEIQEGFNKIFTYGCRTVNFTGGEPTLRPDLEEIIGYASRLGMWTSLVTNGSFLTRERIRGLKNAGLDNLLVSLDSADSDTHDKQRGVKGSYDKVIDCLNWMRDDFLRGHRIGGIMCVISDMNVHHIEQIMELATVIGVNVVFQPYHDNKTGNSDFIAEISESLVDKILLHNKHHRNILCMRSYLRKFIDYYRQESLPLCHAGKKYFSIDPFGYLHPCVDMPSAGHLLKDDVKVVKSDEALKNVLRCKGCWYTFRGEGDMALSLKGHVEMALLYVNSVLRNTQRKKRHNQKKIETSQH